MTSKDELILNIEMLNNAVKAKDILRNQLETTRVNVMREQIQFQMANVDKEISLISLTLDRLKLTL